MRRLGVSAVVLAVLTAATSAAAAQTVSDLRVVDRYEQQAFRDVGGGLSARYAAVDAPEGEQREINVLQIPLGAQGGGTATAQLLTDAAEGFRRRAEEDCAEVRSRTLDAPGAATALEIVCEGFGPQGGAGSAVNSYLYARFEEVRGTLVVISYQWRSERAAAESVRASDLRAQEVEPRIEEIRRALDSRLSD